MNWVLIMWVTGQVALAATPLPQYTSAEACGLMGERIIAGIKKHGAGEMVSVGYVCVPAYAP